MANITIRTSWLIDVDTPELRLILKALGGRLKSNQEVNEAKAFGDQLTEIRASVTKNAMSQADALLSAIDR